MRAASVALSFVDALTDAKLIEQATASERKAQDASLPPRFGIECRAEGLAASKIRFLVEALKVLN
jgi:hypothetical protein